MSTPTIDHDRLPYRIAVLCYLYDHDGRVLMIHRRKKPNDGMYSPIGGKLEVGEGESPHSCAVREIREESGLDIAIEDVRLNGMVSERAYEGETHWLIFLFDVLVPIDPADITEMVHEEGALEWVEPDDVPTLEIPKTDREIMWPLMQRHRGGFFAVDIDCRDGGMAWEIRESRGGSQE